MGKREDGRKQPDFSLCVNFVFWVVFFLSREEIEHFLAFSGREQRFIRSAHDPLASVGQQLKVAVCSEQHSHPEGIK